MSQFDATVENIDESILNNMGNLSQVIGGTQYQVGSPEQLPEGVNLTGVGDPNVPADVAPYLGNVANPGSVGVTPQQVPGAGTVDPAEYQRLQEVAYNASMARIEAEEQAFLAQIANLSEEEQKMAITERELEQTREVNEWLNNKVQGSQQQAQEQNKSKWMMLVATQAGLPLANQGIVTALSTAKNVQEMYNIANGLKQLAGNNAVPNTMNNGILAGGSRPMPTAPQGPKRGSGDVAGLIASRGPISVNMG